jgi:hypothetical protein
MDRKYIDDHHIVARYLAGQLSADERDAFEAYYVEHPEMMSEMESTARFKLGLRKLREQGQLGDLLRPAPWYRQWRYLAAAAALALLTLGVAFTFQRVARMTPLLASSISALSGKAGALSLAKTYLVERSRGRAVDAEIVLPDRPEAIELRVMPEFKARPEQYRVTLLSVAEDDSTQALAEIGQLKMADDGCVAVFINSERVHEGLYQVAVRGDNGTDSERARNTFVLGFRAQK